MNEIENSLLPVITVENGHVITCNEVFTEQVGLHQSEIEGMLLQDILILDNQDGQGDSHSFTTWFKEAKQSSDALFKSASIKNCHHCWMPVQLSCQIIEGTVDSYQLCFRVLVNRSLDPITGLPNGWAIQSRANYLLKSSVNTDRHFSMILLNMDNFSTINYRYGFEAGDNYLLVLGKKIKKIVGARNLVTRLNNAKFGVLIENRDGLLIDDFIDQLNQICMRLCHMANEPLLLDSGISVNKACSIGVSKYSVDYSSFRAMEISAETAMLQARKYSESRYFFSTTKTSVDLLSRKLTIDEFPRAIEQDKLTISFQPQYSLSTDELIGFEALSRWNHKVLGYIPPDVFVAIAEEIGLHFEFDLWVINKVCLQIVDWKTRYAVVPKVAINISLKTLEMSNFVDRASVIIERTQCPVEYIEFELTETASVKNSTALNDNIRLLKQKGISIAIDDFGAGYSSLSLIKEFHLSLDKLKLDRSLVKDICNTPVDKEFAKQIIKLSKVLDVKIVAEGIEEKEQKDLLKLLGCDYAQGYYFDKPLPVKEAEKLIQNKAR